MKILNDRLPHPAASPLSLLCFANSSAMTQTEIANLRELMHAQGKHSKSPQKGPSQVLNQAPAISANHYTTRQPCEEEQNFEVGVATPENNCVPLQSANSG